MDEIDPITCTVLDSQLADAFAYRLHIAGIAEGEPTDAGGNLCSGLIVSEFSQPSGERFRLPNLNHSPSVAQKLRRFRREG